jgi:hypothetical protein
MFLSGERRGRERRGQCCRMEEEGPLILPSFDRNLGLGDVEASFVPIEVELPMG